MRRESFSAEVDCECVEVPLKPPRAGIIRDALKQFPDTTAVFASTDHIARDVYEVAAELGLSIPGDLSVVGYSDLEFAKYLYPTLTTVHANPYAMGCRAASLLIGRLEDRLKENKDCQVDYLPVELINRNSTKAL